MAPKPEIKVERSKLIEGARTALRRIEVSEEIISRLQDVIDTEWQSVYRERSTLRAILQRAGVEVPSDPGDWEHAAQRFVDSETSDGN
jgi:hypothetical protein